MNVRSPKVALLEVSHWHAPLYFDALDALDVPVVAVSDEIAEVSESVAARFGCRHYRDFRLLLDKERPEFVFVFGKHRQMPDIARSVIEAGAGMAIEKPVGISSAPVSEIYRLATQRSAFVAIPFVLRHSPLFRRIQESIGDGPFGRLTHMCCRFIAGPPQRYLQTSSGWMLDRSVSGGGCTINLGVHFIDLFLHLVTPAHVSEVFAAMSNRKYQLSIEDFSSISLLASDGTRSTVETGYAYPSSLRDLRDIGYFLTTTAGYLKITAGEACWRGHDGSSWHETPVTAMEPFYRLFVEDTLRAFVEGNEPAASLSEMVAVMQVIDAAYTSAEEGRIVAPE